MNNSNITTPTSFVNRLVNGRVAARPTGRAKPPAGPRIPPVEAWARRLGREASDWARFAPDHSTLNPGRAAEKSYQALAASLIVGARSLAVPTKARGVKPYQSTVVALAGAEPWASLDLVDDGDALALEFEGRRVGYLTQDYAWVRPLVRHLSFRVRRVTGTDRPWLKGVNLFVTGVGSALACYETQEAAPDDAVAAPGRLERLRLVRPEHEVLTSRDPLDVVLMRDVSGRARATCPVWPVHSPTGYDFGPRAGRAAVADLAAAVLEHVAGPEAAEAVAVAFADELRKVPHAGGCLLARDVRAFVARHAGQ